MALTAGTITLVKKTHDSLTVNVTAATGGTGTENYSYAWYISKNSGFSPDESSATGVTGQTGTITGLIPGQVYYLINVVTDAGASNVTASSTQFTAQTDAHGVNINQFAQTPELGQVDLRYSVNTISGTAGEDLVSGQAVKWGSDGKLHAATANTDRIDGFVVFNVKKNIFKDGDSLEFARAGSYITLRATSALNAGDPAAIDPTCIGGITAILSTEPPCAQATKTVAAGELVVAYLVCPAL